MTWVSKKYWTTKSLSISIERAKKIKVNIGETPVSVDL